MAGSAEKPGRAGGPATLPETVFAPVRSYTAFEETVDRLGTAIKLGLLAPGAQLPAERELCARLGIARSTLRQALTALTQSGHVFATRGRGGGTFVSDPQPPAIPPTGEELARWRETCDQRLAVELGVAVLASERAQPPDLDQLDDVAAALELALDDFAAYRQGDIRLHVGLAEATGSGVLVRAMTEVQGAMTDLIAHIAHPPEVLASSNVQHRRLLAAVRERDTMLALRSITEHLQGTEHILAGLLPDR
ncbi:MAG TPA: FCD domain-containing protein [Solirubrobacteraceae bacterium]|jgi:DNA-binding FadR family transcriptional regulator|nr:FCD domain-containing protein [Solirubrobacteraceae bacterium]